MRYTLKAIIVIYILFVLILKTVLTTVINDGFCNIVMKDIHLTSYYNELPNIDDIKIVSVDYKHLKQPKINKSIQHINAIDNSNANDSLEYNLYYINLEDKGSLTILKKDKQHEYIVKYMIIKMNSDHILDGIRGDMELQIIHYNKNSVFYSKLEDINELYNKINGFINNISDNKNNKYDIYTISDLLIISIIITKSNTLESIFNSFDIFINDNEDTSYNNHSLYNINTKNTTTNNKYTLNIENLGNSNFNIFDLNQLIQPHKMYFYYNSNNTSLIFKDIKTLKNEDINHKCYLSNKYLNKYTDIKSVTLNNSISYYKMDWLVDTIIHNINPNQLDIFKKILTQSNEYNNYYDNQLNNNEYKFKKYLTNTIANNNKNYNTSNNTNLFKVDSLLVEKDPIIYLLFNFSLTDLSEMYMYSNFKMFNIVINLYITNIIIFHN